MSAFPNQVIIRNARQHNLKGITVELPRRALTVITGPSGSGKSSLAFDTLYAEGQRRYIESLSTYAKQFLERMPKPLVDSIDGISPAVAIEQKNPTTTSRSTVGTATEIYDFLRLLWARVGTPYCVKCGREVKADTVQEYLSKLERKLISLSNAHKLLHKSDWDNVLFSDLLSVELDRYKTIRNVEVSGPRIVIPQHKVFALCLIVHELATNAAKHGALTNPTGRLLISWMRNNSGVLSMN